MAYVSKHQKGGAIITNTKPILHYDEFDVNGKVERLGIWIGNGSRMCDQQYVRITNKQAELLVGRKFKWDESPIKI